MEPLKELFLMRHAKSSWEEANRSDFDRDLSPRGVTDAQLIAKRNLDALTKLDLILSSPALRARRTTQLLCQAIACNEGIIQWIDDIYEASTHTLLKMVRGLPAHTQRVMLVGHNPGFTSLCNHFLREPLDNLPTSGLATLTFSAHKWEQISKECLVFSAVDFPKGTQ